MVMNAMSPWSGARNQRCILSRLNRDPNIAENRIPQFARGLVRLAGFHHQIQVYAFSHKETRGFLMVDKAANPERLLHCNRRNFGYSAGGHKNSDNIIGQIHPKFNKILPSSYWIGAKNGTQALLDVCLVAP
jgi:hypothetical protein